MKEQQENLIEYIKSISNLRGCITGSALLPEYYEHSDVDVFMYDSKSFTKLYYTLINNPMFTILDKLENWKAMMFETQEEKKQKYGLITLKFIYNTCLPVNIILKNDKTNIFSVLSSFDMDIVCKGYCLQAKKELDLTGNPGKVANINTWNPAFNSSEIWSVSRILRQLERTIKYHKRGFNTDAVILKYIELIDNVQEYESVFNSENFSERLKTIQENTKVVKQLCEVWLETHEISNEQLELLKLKIKEI